MSESTDYICKSLDEKSYINVPYDLSYSCMGNEYNTNGSLNDTTIGFNESCKIDTYDVSCGIYKLKLEYTSNNNVISSVDLVYENGKDIRKSLTFVNSINREHCKTLFVSNVKDYLTELSDSTTISLTNFDQQIDEESDDIKTNALYTEDGYFRLIIIGEKPYNTK